jgi:hypothetical protein
MYTITNWVSSILQRFSITLKKKKTFLFKRSAHVFDNIYETEQGVFAIGINDKSIVKIQFNGLLNTQLSKFEYNFEPNNENYE